MQKGWARFVRAQPFAITQFNHELSDLTKVLVKIL
jgi:hypothetical protein